MGMTDGSVRVQIMRIVVWRQVRVEEPSEAVIAENV